MIAPARLLPSRGVSPVLILMLASVPGCVERVRGRFRTGRGESVQNRPVDSVYESILSRSLYGAQVSLDNGLDVE